MTDTFWDSVPAAPVFAPAPGGATAVRADVDSAPPPHDDDGSEALALPDPRSEHEALAAAYEADTVALTDLDDGSTAAPDEGMPTFSEVVDPKARPADARRAGIFRRRGR